MHLDFTKIDWYNVLPQFGIDERFLRKSHGPCPICDGSKRNKRFRFSNKDGMGEWFCSHCKGGNALTLLRLFTCQTDKEILQQIEEYSGIEHTSTGPVTPYRDTSEISKEEADENRPKLISAWRDAKALMPADPVSKYLSSRVPGANLEYLRSVRFLQRMGFWELDENDKSVFKGNFPVMIAKVVDGSGMPITLHRTYLTNKGERAPFSMTKKQMKGVRKLRGAAIRLTDIPESRVLGVCEGIETGWAVSTAYRYKINVWSLLNAGNLGVADIPRSRFDKVIIFADHDKIDLSKGYRPGEHYALMLKEKLEKQGFAVEVKIPPVEETDFADLWMQHFKSFNLKSA